MLDAPTILLSGWIGPWLDRLNGSPPSAAPPKIPNPSTKKNAAAKVAM